MRWRDRLAVLALAAMFCWPWALALTLGPNSHPWLLNRTLAGVVRRPSEPPLTWPALREHRWQAWFEDQVVHRLPGREAIVRLTNEAHFRLYGQPATLNTLSVGRGDALFETGYLTDYAFNRAAPDPGLLDLLQRTQEGLRSRGVGFVVVLSPSKAALMPEWAPAGWEARLRPGRREAERFVEEALRRGIALVDGHAITVAVRRPGEPPVFPLGGTHWGDKASFETSRAVVAALREQNLPVRELACDPPVRHENPAGDDADLVGLMNLVFPWHYPCWSVNVRPEVIPEDRRLTLTVVGGSFSAALQRHLASSGQFAEVRHFQHRLPANLDVLTADCVVFEINEAGLARHVLLADVCRQLLRDRTTPDLHSSFQPQELTASRPQATLQLRVPTGELRLALTVQASQPQTVRVLGREGLLSQRALPAGLQEVAFSAPSSPRGRLFLQVQSHGADLSRKLLLREVRVQPSAGFWWPTGEGQLVSFGSRSLDRALRGFSPAEGTLRWTEQPLAEVSLQVPLRDQVLDFRVAPYLHPRFLPAQRVRVYGNGVLLTVWGFQDRATGWRRVAVPARVLGPGGRLTVRFELASTCSPAEAGEGADARQLGLLFEAVRLGGGSGGGRAPAADSSRAPQRPARHTGRRG